ncbi:MAG: CHAT domain-containing protein, partial [Actinomycetota bacterium]
MVIGTSDDGVSELRLRGGGRPEIVVPFRNPLTKSEVAAALGFVDGGLVSGSEAKAIGAKLFDSLFNSREAYELLSRLDESAETVRLRISSHDGAAAAMPWELLYNENSDEYLAREWSVVRWPAGTGVSEGLAGIRPEDKDGQAVPIRTLVVAASPDGYAPIDVDGEVANLVSVFAASGAAEDPVVLRNATREELIGTLAEAKTRPFHIIHFAGHSTTEPGGQTYLLMEGEETSLGASDFAMHLSGQDTKLVFLNSCSSAGMGDSVSGHLLPAFAAELVDRGVPAIVGMQTTVADPFANQAARVFYRSLLAGQPIDGALADVRRLAETQEQGRQDNIGIPVLYLRPGASDARLYTPAPGRNWPRLVTKVAVWLLVAGIPAVLVYGALLGDLFRGAEPPRPMAGDFNIAIAEPQLLEGDDLARNEGVSLADSMHLRFSETFCGETNGTEIVDGFLYDCWSPEMIGAVVGEDDAAREEAAAELARTIRADIVVYGTVTQRNGQLEFAPVVYIADRQLLRAEEFSGAHTLVSSSGN